MAQLKHLLKTVLKHGFYLFADRQHRLAHANTLLNQAYNRKDEIKLTSSFSEDGRFVSMRPSYKTPVLHFNFETCSAQFIQ